MTIDQLRKKYPFISYGAEYDRWKRIGKWYKWLSERIMSERPTTNTLHEWRKLAIYFQSELRKRNALFKKLPKPTKEQYSDQDDPDYPWTTGKWPEDAMADIRMFANAEDKCYNMSRDVAAILTENDYYTDVVEQKTYESNKEKYGE